MRLLLMVVMLSNMAQAQLIWDKKDILDESTQTVRVYLGESPRHGVLLLKHYKYGRPLYLISTFEDLNVDQTKMVTQEHFYAAYGAFHDIFEKIEPNAEKCKNDLSITRKLGDRKVHQHQFCMEKFGVATRKALKSWYGSLKGGI